MKGGSGMQRWIRPIYHSTLPQGCHHVQPNDDRVTDFLSSITRGGHQTGIPEYQVLRGLVETK